MGSLYAGSAPARGNDAAGFSDRVTNSLSVRGPKEDVFAELTRAWPLPVPGAKIWEQYRARMPDLVSCAIGIVTNGMADNQEGKIRNSGVADLVDGLVISSEVGSRKPDPDIFRALAARLDHPHRGWMVGDSLEPDIAGGAGVSLTTAWITDSPSPPHRPSDPRSPHRPSLTP